MPIVKLPRKRLISMDRDTITIDMPDEVVKEKKEIDFEAIKKARGIWKDAKIDGVEYQKKIRSEWD
jgi:hypothetical protein